MMPDPGFGPCIKMLNDFMDREANHHLKAQNLTRSQCHLLMILHHQREHTASLKKLESEFQVSQPTIVGLVSRLEGKGLITSFTDPGDRRIKLVQLTDAGRETCLQAFRDIQMTEQQLTTVLSPEEKEQLLSLLHRVCTSLR